MTHTTHSTTPSSLAADVWLLSINSDSHSISRINLVIEDTNTGRYRVMYTARYAGVYEVSGKVQGGATSLEVLGTIVVKEDSQL